MSETTITQPKEATAACVQRGNLAVVRPQFNTKQTNDTLEVGVALPGVKKDAISVAYERGVLSISAERTHNLKDGETLLRREINDVCFELQLKVADTLDAENISAKFEDGILTLGLKVREDAKPRTIEIH